MKEFIKLMIGEDFTTADIIPAIKTFAGLILILSIVTLIEKL
jgi:hypothetical protein